MLPARLHSLVILLNTVVILRGRWLRLVVAMLLLR